jgi:hypothetical protein
VQELSVHDLTFIKASQTLTTFASDLQAQAFDLDSVVNRVEPFQIRGEREARTYQFYDVQREGARHEVGDVTAWLFRHVDSFGRALPGQRMIVFND